MITGINQTIKRFITIKQLKDWYTLPRIDDVFDCLYGAKWFFNCLYEKWIPLSWGGRMSQGMNGHLLSVL